MLLGSRVRLWAQGVDADSWTLTTFRYGMHNLADTAKPRIQTLLPGPHGLSAHVLACRGRLYENPKPTQRSSSARGHIYALQKRQRYVVDSTPHSFIRRAGFLPQATATSKRSVSPWLLQPGVVSHSDIAPGHDGSIGKDSSEVAL